MKDLLSLLALEVKVSFSFLLLFFLYIDSFSLTVCFGTSIAPAAAVFDNLKVEFIVYFL